VQFDQVEVCGADPGALVGLPGGVANLQLHAEPVTGIGLQVNSKTARINSQCTRCATPTTGASPFTSAWRSWAPTAFQRVGWITALRAPATFGRQPNPGTKMPYFQATDQDWWDEDAGSSTYNTHVRGADSPSSITENLYDAGPVYDYAGQRALGHMRGSIPETIAPAAGVRRLPMLAVSTRSGRAPAGKTSIAGTRRTIRVGARRTRLPRQADRPRAARPAAPHQAGAGSAATRPPRSRCRAATPNRCGNGLVGAPPPALAQQHHKKRCRVDRAVVGHTVEHVTAAPPAAPLVQDPARLLLGHRINVPPLQPGESLQRADSEANIQW